MALYFISIDLRDQNKNYEKLYSELKKFSSTKILDSLWCFNRFNTNTINLTDYFRSYMDKGDGIIVIEATDWASFSTITTPLELELVH